MNYMPGTASLIEDIDKKHLVLLRDGRTLIGYLRSIDQFANLVLHQTVERIHVGKKYGDIPRGIFVVRGENVVLLGEIHSTYSGDQLFSEVMGLLEKRVIEPVPSQDCFQGTYSRLFLVGKPDGSFRPILDLKSVNRFVRKERFRMDTIGSASRILRPGDFMVTLDLQDAYLHVPVVEWVSRQFLRVAVQSGGRVFHFQFRALPFGLSSAPRVFSTILIVITAFLRHEGLYIVPYLDDWLLKASTVPLLEAHLARTIEVLSRHGWLVNWRKSRLVPVQRIVFLGFVLDTSLMAVFLSDSNKEKLQGHVRALLLTLWGSVRGLLRVLGHLTAAIPAVPWARAHARGLQGDILSQWDGDLDRSICISGSTRARLLWWLRSPFLGTGVPMALPEWLTVTTDASLSGWGAHCRDVQAHGVWDPWTGSLSSNARELLGGSSGSCGASAWSGRAGPVRQRRHGVLPEQTRGHAFAPPFGSVRHHHGLGRAPSASALCGPHPRCAQRPGRFSEPCFSGATGLVPVSGVLRGGLSFGLPVIDLMASRLSAKVPRFASLRRDCPDLLDAFSFRWAFELAYVFPPRLP
uniref:ribonuclease H n=1 Tax=Leptobrachium leishanense TaxID=445787 RepID=A0A8C5PV42_9ANUR